MTEAYCCKCKTKRKVSNEVKTKTKKGVPMTRGVCSVCGTKVCMIGK
jgi:DNA topoisomerase-1